MDMADGIGLSVGATALQAVAIGRSAVRRSPVLTLYRHQPAEVGVPSENPNLVDRGLIVTDFVDRVGDPVPIVAADGSSHRAEALLADALRSLLFALTGGRPPAEPVGVTHPAHWNTAAIEALRVALAAQPEFRAVPMLTSDALTALTALQDDPGLPTRGIVALSDVGGTGASITLADAANGFQPIGPTVRHADLSGDLIDQSLLARVIADLGQTGAVDMSSTAAIGSLSRLRGQCRVAKERLSTSAVTSIPVDLPGNRTEVRVTRVELDDAIRGPVTGFVELLQETLQRNGIRSSDLVAVASVGGVAHLPILTTTLSERMRVPVISSGQPELAAAIGGGLTAIRGLVSDGATSMAPVAADEATSMAPAAAVVPAGNPQGSSTFRALAWSDADDVPEPTPADPSHVDYATNYEPFDPRPPIAFTHPDEDPAEVLPLPWYRRPVAMFVIGLILVAAVLAGTALYVLRDDGSSAPASTPATTGTTAPPAESPPAPQTPPGSEATPVPQTETRQAPPASEAPPAPRTETQQAPPPSEAPATQPPEPAPPPPPPPSEAPATQPVEPSQPPPPPQPPTIPSLPYRTIPGLPFVPAPIQP
jgi:Hsp70 protein